MMNLNLDWDKRKDAVNGENSYDQPEFGTYHPNVEVPLATHSHRRHSCAAAIKGEAKRRTCVAEDPGYASDSSCDAYLDLDHVSGNRSARFAEIVL